MSWNFAGQGWRNGQAIQCGPGPNRQHCGADAPWPDQTQRRIYAAKQSIAHLIDLLEPADLMRVVVYSTNGITATANWSSDKLALKQAVQAAGAVAGDPFRTAGEAPIASALYRARQLVAQIPPNDQNGQPYHIQSIVLSDSVANSFLIGDGGWLYDPATTCPGVEFPEDMASCYIGYTSAQPPIPKPITAMIQQADLLKPLATIFVVALAGVDQTGLPNVASAPNFPYFASADSADMLTGALDSMVSDTIHYTCMPQGGTTWFNTIDAAHLPDPSAGIPGLSATVVGYVYLYDQEGNALPGDLRQVPVRRDPQTGYLSYTAAHLAPGTYQLAAMVAYKGDDGATRAYPALYNPYTATTDQRLVFTLGSNTGADPLTMTPLYLDVNGSVCPNS
jgi:hypothetical protein